MQDHESQLSTSYPRMTGKRETICLATIWPRDPHGRSEDFVLGELLKEYETRERNWSLRVVVASAHQSALEVAREVTGRFPDIRADFWWMETEHAGRRAEEISFCKEQLPLRLAAEPGWDWIFYYDADVWTRITQVPEWIDIVGSEKERCFVKIKYTLRDKLESPAHTLGAYFHHRALLERLEYWKAVFPRRADGRRRNAPDRALHDFLERTHRCRKVVPEGIESLHFLNGRDAHHFDAGISSRAPGVHGRSQGRHADPRLGICSRAPGVRDEAGAWAEPWNPMPEPAGGPATMNVVTLWHHEPHPAQARLADYLATAEFPAGSVFVWGLASGMEASLEAARQALTQRGCRVEVVRIEPPAAPIRDDHAKHCRVTELYNRIVPMLGEPTALFMEDDVIPLDRDAAPRLAALLARMPESSGMVAGAYRSRPNPMGACAVAERYLFWDRLPAGPATRTMRVRWAGAGLTLFRTSALRAVMPFRFQIDAKVRKGWDIFVSEDFRNSGREMWLAPGIRAEHRCPEVLAYCAAKGCAVA